MVIIAISALALVVGAGVVRSWLSPPVAVATAATPAPAPDERVLVHVVGQVNRPGLYVLSGDARLVDAIAAAAGMTHDADPVAINLARPVSDGERIYVPAVGEETADPSAADSPTRIDLNQAPPAQLQTLPGIGPALAERIVRWRGENGPFATVDELTAVPGIGPAVLESVREHVVV